MTGAAPAASAFDDPLDFSEGGPRLVGGRCGACDEVLFPLRPRCPRCASAEVERIMLPDRGTLWTWTIQGFEPKAPYASAQEEFVPFGVGYVELEGHLRVETRLTTADPDELVIGMPVVLTAFEDGGRMLYAFAPAEDEA
jgi:uncharacterized OB-fold protein